MNRYVCTKTSYPNCRAHDGGFPSGLSLFESILDVQKAVIDGLADTAYGDVYSIETGKVVATFSYELSHHVVSGLAMQMGVRRAVLIDNGSGTKTWSGKIVPCERCKATGKVKPKWRSTLDAVLPVRFCSECGDTYDPLERHDKQDCSGNPRCPECDGEAYV